MKSRVPFILILLLCCQNYQAQRDTICTRQDQLIPCVIYKSSTGFIEYGDARLRSRTIDMHMVKWYSYKGQRTVPRLNGGLLNTQALDTVDAGDELRHLRFCLDKFHKQYTTGMTLDLVGGIATAGAVFLPPDHPSRKALGIGGIALMVAGTIVIFDAHKWIGRAALGVNAKGNSIEVYYKFK